MTKEFLETIRLENGKVYHLAYHQKRVESVFEMFHQDVRGYNLSTLFVAIPKEGLYRVRIVYNLQGEFTLSYVPYIKREIKSFKLLEDATLHYGCKFANRDTLDRLFAKKGDCDEIIITQNGYITDTSIANIALFDGKQWWTPKNPLLKGTTRQRLLERGFLKEKVLHVKDISQYKKLSLMNAMIDFDIIAELNLKDIMC